MKLIVERIDGEMYVYTEDDKLFETVEGDRAHRSRRLLQQRAIEILNQECCIEANSELEGDFYMVFELAEQQLKTFTVRAEEITTVEMQVEAATEEEALELAAANSDVYRQEIDFHVDGFEVVGKE